MAFTSAELANIANATLDYYIRGMARSQTLQTKPLYRAMVRAEKTFPGGKGDISLPVKGVYTTTVMGYTHNDQVTYQNPANIKRVNYPWREHHAGIGVTLTELKHSGISVVDSDRSKQTTQHSRSELVVLTNLLKDKLEDMQEGWERSMNNLYWGDGTTDAKALAGLRSVIVDNPATGTVGGLAGTADVWWRNRASVNDGTTDSRVDVTGGADLVETINKELRQLRRYGGSPRLALCGSDFLDQLIKELRAKGYYTDSNWNKRSATDIAIAEVHHGGLTFQYDPSMDDLGTTVTNADFTKRCYLIDTNRIYPYAMEGEARKRHTPSRPHDQYVMYRAMTWTGQLVCDQRNSSGVLEFK